MFSPDDTIAAIATPPGHGGIGVVRVSGPRSPAIAAALTGRGAQALPPRRAVFTRVRSRQGGAEGGSPTAFDQVVCTFFPGPGSYTGEDLVEISAHGSPVVLNQILTEACSHGARQAQPGEFTLRAYLNGRIDLVQAEAVADLVEAVTPHQARAAFDQLEGTLTGAIRDLERPLFDLIVRLEASLDFPEEGYRFASRQDVAKTLDEVQASVVRLLGTAEAGRLIREGAQVVVSGRPNVGKSSIFNSLLGTDRAIVTATPGTTRDLLTERCDVGGIPVTLVDTAGVRESPDEVEREGVTRARRAMAVADLVLLVVDQSAPLGPADEELIAAVAVLPHVVAANKTDLPLRWSLAEIERRLGPRVLPVSAKTGEGVATLREELAKRLGAAEAARDTPAVTNIRHARLLHQVRLAVERAQAATQNQASEEFVLADLRDAIQAFDQIVGARSPNEVLDTIFARFCIGK